MLIILENENPDRGRKLSSCLTTALVKFVLENEYPDRGRKPILTL